MFRRIVTLVALATLVLSLAGPGVASVSADVRLGIPQNVPDHYIVVFKDDVKEADSATIELEAEHGLSVDHIYGSAIRGFAATIPAERLDAVKADPRVLFVSEDRIVHAVGTTPVVAGDSVPTGVRRIGAGTTTTVHQASTINVAVIDTGIDLTHPDLNAVSGKNCVRTNRNANDDNGHGTHVAGTIAAKNNGSGVEGVAPGTKLYAVKVLNAQGSGTWSQVICGIDWVTANAAALNIKVASMSLGGSGASDTNCGNSNNDAMHKAICNSVAKGVTYVVAAGNNGANMAGFTPGSYPEVLAVTAISDSDGLASGKGGAPSCFAGQKDDSYATFSNYAVSAADQNHTVAGPGVCIKSTWKNGGYNTISGTSMATPHLSGVVALCIGNGGTAGPCSGLTPAQIVQKIRSDAQTYATAANGFSGDPLHAVSGKYFGFLAWAGGY